MIASAPQPDAPHSVRSAYIKDVADQAGRDLRLRHPVLQHQDAIGAAILALAMAGMTASGLLYVLGLWPAYLTIAVSAVFASLTHELEHDLIHKMYFKKVAWAHRLMMALVWVARPNTVSPWLRTHLHFNHHKTSGTPVDIEERAITNGVPWSPKRLLMLWDAPLSVLLRLRESPAPRKTLVRALVAYFPLGTAFWLTWHAFVLFHLANGLATVVGRVIPWSPGVVALMHQVSIGVVVLIAPNLLRSFSLNFISSNMHYYGDVEAGNQLQECQVLDAWIFAPLHLFCFNFGATHAIHHFLVKEPFYIRQMTARQVLPVMKEMGVRFNDLATFRRANRRGVQAAHATPLPTAKAGYAS